MSIEAVLFDIDGTLVDSNEQHVLACGFAFRDAGRPQEHDALRGQIGKGGDLLVPALVPDLAPAARRRIEKAHGAYFKDLYFDEIRPFPDAAALVQAVHRSGRHVVLASSAKREELDHYVALLGLGDLLAATTSIDDVATSKPAPDIFGTALEKIGVAPERAVVVGDTPYDVAAATTAGILSIGVATGPFTADQLREAGAAAVFKDVADLLANLARSPLAG